MFSSSLNPSIQCLETLQAAVSSKCRKSSLKTPRRTYYVQWKFENKVYNGQILVNFWEDTIRTLNRR